MTSNQVIQCNFQNISEGNEAALSESEDIYRRLAELSPDMMAVLCERRFIYINPAGADILGAINSEDISGKLLHEVLPAAESDFLLEQIRRALDENRFQKFEYSLQLNETKVWFDGSISPMSKNSVVWTAHDITKRKQVEQEKARLDTQMENQNQRLTNIVASVPGIVWEAWGEPDTSTQRIDFISEYVETMLGYSVEEWLTTPNFWLSIVHPEDRESAILNATETFASRKAGTNRFRWIGKDGRVIWVEVKSIAICDEAGNPLGMRGVAMDISERKQMEQALAHSEAQLRQSRRLESVGRWAGGIAHDFNNMLTVINGYSELSLRHLKKGNLRSNIEEIKKAGERSALLTYQLLAFSRQQVLKPETVDLNKVVGEISNILQRLISKDIHLVTRLNSKPGYVNADPGQLSHLVMNLVVNARDAMPQGGTLTIKTKNFTIDEKSKKVVEQHISVKPGAYIELSVSDTGIGMDEATQQHIFEPFYTNKGIGLGTGLGLAMVYDIVKQSGGHIFVDSKIGKGTTFKIYLPQVDEEVESSEGEKLSKQILKGTETILIADDEDIVRALTRRILEEGGYEVIEARNGIEALSIFEMLGCKIDLLITDVVMLQMGGRELAKRLATKYSSTRILFTSGYLNDATIRQGKQEFNTNFIKKPFAPESLAQKVRELLDIVNIDVRA